MFICPNCQGRLVRTSADGGAYWSCPACQGRAVNFSLLRQKIDNTLADQLWAAARAKQGEEKRACPMCGDLMITVAAVPAEKPLALDVCPRCQFVWFDPKEYEAMPAAARPERGRGAATVTEARKSEQARRDGVELEARIRDDLAAANGEGEHKSYTLIPDSEILPERWKLLPMFLGMPVEQEVRAVQQRPLATWFLAAGITLISLVAFVDLHRAVNVFGLIPAHVWRYGALTLLTSFFLHGGLLHLAGNMYFLLTFGDNVEDFLGRGRYLVLLLLATMVGDVLHVALDPHSNMPVVGASGGISGLIAFYGLQFPRARLIVWFRLFWFRIRAWVAILLWILLQFAGAAEQMAGHSSVSSLAHLGGAGTGLVFWLIWRKS